MAMPRALLPVAIVALGCPGSASKTHGPPTSTPSSPVGAAEPGQPPTTEPPTPGPEAALTLRVDPLLVHACPSRSPDLIEATRGIEALGQQIAALRPESDPARVYFALLQLLDTPCFALAHGEGIPRPPEDGLALITWWQAGGRRWLEHYLTIDWNSPRARVSVVPPSIRSTLTPQTDPKHPLRSLMCPLRDPQCVGKEERAFRERARAALRDAANPLGGKLSIAPSDTEGTEITFGWSGCEEIAALAPEYENYATFRDCVELATERRWALPIGGLRAPKSGWVIVQGRRGHYQFCDELRIYDIETGAAYIARTCSGLFTEDHEGDAQPAFERGNISKAKLREAVWMALWAPEADSMVVTTAHDYPMSGDYPASRPTRSIYAPQRSWGTSAQTLLRWTLVQKRKPIAMGSLLWPSDGYSDAGHYATELLATMEESFQPGCPRAALPKLPLEAWGGGVSIIDADPSTVTATQRKLLEQLKTASTSSCTPPGST